MPRRSILALAALLALACRAGPVPAVAGDTPRAVSTPRFVFTAASRVRSSAEGDSLELAVTVRNRADSTVHLSFGACPVEPRLRRADGNAVAWVMPPRICPMYMRLDTLAAGAAMSPGEFRVAVPVASILGDSLPAGLYRVQARFALMGDSATIEAGTVRLGR